MGKTFVIVVGLILLVIVLMAVGGTLMEPDSSVSSSVSTPPKEIIVTKSPDQLLPVRSDIGTIWKIKDSDLSNVLTDSNGNPKKGFTEGATQRYVKTEGEIVSITTTAVVGVFMFDNPTNSFNFYVGKIQRLIDEGGFEEIPAKARDATCYGLKKSAQAGFLTYEVDEFRCVKGNVYTYVRSSSEDIWDDDTAPEFMRMVLDKIV